MRGKCVRMVSGNVDSADEDPTSETRLAAMLQALLGAGATWQSEK